MVERGINCLPIICKVLSPENDPRAGKSLEKRYPYLKITYTQMGRGARQKKQGHRRSFGVSKRLKRMVI